MSAAVEDPPPDRYLIALATAAIAFPLVYLVSDVIEVVQGNFSTLRLSLTYVGEAGFPLFVMGIGLWVRDRIDWWGLFGAVAYAYSFVFFTSTVVWALVGHAHDWAAVDDHFGWWLTIHGAVMVVGGVAFGAAVVRSGALPRWTGLALALGVVLVAAASGGGDVVRMLAAAVPDAAFIGMGLALVRRHDDVDSVEEARFLATDPVQAGPRTRLSP